MLFSGPNAFANWGQCSLQSPKNGSDWRSNPVAPPVLSPIVAPAGAKLIYAVGESEAVLAIVSPFPSYTLMLRPICGETNATHEIYLVTSPPVPKKWQRTLRIR